MMVKSFFIKFIFLATFTYCVLCTEPHNNTVKAENVDPVETARQYVKNFLDDKKNELVPGLVVGVSVKGEQKWLEGFGVANIENNVSMMGDAVMQIGSISKSFTVGLASRLMQEGKLDFDVPIRNYLSTEDFPDKKWNGSVVNITMRQLLQMTAGIPNGPEQGESGACLLCKNQTGHLIFMRDKELEFEPGTNFTYSNFGYELAGVIIESVLENRTFDDAIKEMVENVLKLKQTDIADSHVITPHMSSFYTVREGKLHNSGMWGEIYLNELHAAGGIITTMTDLLTYGQIWLDAYMGRSEHFLKQSTAKSAWTPNEISTMSYGMGWVIQNVTGNRPPRGRQVVWHNGGTIGCRSILAIYPETEIIVAISANLGECVVDTMVNEIADFFANVTQS